MSGLELELGGCDGGVEGRNGHLVDRLSVLIAKYSMSAKRARMRGWQEASFED
jgi:hypothetical protein